MAYMLPVVVNIPVETTFYSEDGDLVIRAVVRVPKNAWKKHGWPTDQQIEAALAVALGKIDLENLNG